MWTLRTPLKMYMCIDQPATLTFTLKPREEWGGGEEWLGGV